MPTGSNCGGFRHLHALFSVGAAGGLTDKQLLDRLATGQADVAEQAYAVLISRHGPMVLHVCRSVLHDPHDVEDAFQATFLVLLQRLNSLWVRDSLGPWLHQVAHRTASCSRSAAVRRRRFGLAIASRTTSLVHDRTPDDLGEVLHEEVSRLPKHQRTAVVLCLLEGMSQEQAAQQLGWPVGTVQSRLARGRVRLRERLTRRGLAPAAVIGAVACVRTAQATMPGDLVDSTIRNALWFASRSTTGGSVPAKVVALAKGVSIMLAFAQVRTYAAAVLVVASVALGAGVLAQQNAPPAEIASQQPGLQSRNSDPGVETKAIPDPKTDDWTSLGDAVKRFNESAANNAIGKHEPPLTEDEVVAAIRGWLPKLYPVDPETLKRYQKVAETGKLPPGSALRFLTGWRWYNGHNFDVWWVDLDLPSADGARQPRSGEPVVAYTYRIRDRILRSWPMTEEDKRRQEQEIERTKERMRERDRRSKGQ